ncbi:hypothetical protein CSUI_006258 [Cystoisospora suis]|uniref:Uncharacterized protein n=1 Tax=Cystoisospora suis TaxID=483139 RepID=A0A2C6KUL0_9APIC|nr:hypothetical protein CSUI_006258 [Cystoisospora suis]
MEGQDNTQLQRGRRGILSREEGGLTNCMTLGRRGRLQRGVEENVGMIGRRRRRDDHRLRPFQDFLLGLDSHEIFIYSHDPGLELHIHVGIALQFLQSEFLDFFVISSKNGRKHFHQSDLEVLGPAPTTTK